jgi:hypothetical protein
MVYVVMYVYILFAYTGILDRNIYISRTM